MGLFFSLIISIVGFGYFRYGKRTMDFLYMISGLFLMVSPYFIGNMFWMFFISLIVVATPIIISRAR